MMEHALIGLAALVGLGILAQWIAWRLHFPSILILLIFGAIAGPFTGWISPNDLLGPSLIPFVSLAVAIILFEGGMSLNIRDLLKIGRVIRNLVTIGAAVTFILTSLAAVAILGMEPPLAVLLGAILVVTGPTVVIPMIRQIRPSKNVGAILRWEGIVIDPIGATLSVLVFEVIGATGIQAAATVIVLVILKTVTIGIVLGILAGLMLTLLLKHHLIPDHLENAVTLMAVLVAFTASDLLQHESGFLTVTVFGIFMASQTKVSIDHIVEFKENLQVLLLGMLFVLLAARLEPDVFSRTNLVSNGAFLVVLILIIRPVAVVISSWRSSLTWKERTMLCWMAPRGIVAASVAAIFALRLAEEGYTGAGQLVPSTFIVIIGTIAVYGLTAMPVARWLGIATPNPQGVMLVGGSSWVRSVGEALKAQDVPVLIADTNWANISAARLAGFRTYYGNILSSKALDEIDLGDIGKMIACTSNDGFNSLCCLHFEEVFGKASVFQLPFQETAAAKNDPHRQSLHGRLVFTADAHFRSLRDLFHQGSRVTTTRLTEEFDLAQLQSVQRFQGIPLFVIRENGNLSPVASGQELQVRPGDRVMSLITHTLPTGTA